MISKYVFRGHILKIAVGMVMLLLVLAGTGIALVGHELPYVSESPDILREKGFSGASQFQMPGRLEDSGTHFELNNSNYLNITLDSSEPVDLTLESIPEMVTIHIESASGATSAQITLGGFTPHTIYHMYEDNYHNHIAFITDASGKYTYTQDLSRPHLVFIQPISSTKFINDNATGGDCTKIGTWNAATKTCTLTGDLTETIQIDSNDTTLNGNGHTITGSGTGSGIYLSGRNGVIIKNLNVEKFNSGIYLTSSSNNMLIGNNASNNNCGYGIYLYSSSNNTLIENNANSNNCWGISLWYSSNNTLSHNNALNNIYGEGISLISSSNNTLSGNNASNNGIGIGLYSSSNNMLSDNNANSNSIYGGIYLYYSSNNNMLSNNNVSNNYYGGIYLYYSNNNNTLSNNNASNNEYGIDLEGSSNSTLINNIMISNSYNFNLDGYQNSEFDNIIDTSNTVDGKPILYIKNGANTIYDSSNAGTIYCIWCNNVTIKNIALIKNGYGIFFWNTNNSEMENITASNNYIGISLWYSSNNTLSGNNASNNIYGIYLEYSSNNMLSSNNVTSNGDYHYHYGRGISLGYYPNSGNNNRIYNNFFNNTNNFEILYSSVNKWNITQTSGTNIIGGSYLGGNFWADPSGTGFSQTCTDNNIDGICDEPYTLDSSNIDYLPLTYKPPIDPTVIINLSGIPIVNQSTKDILNVGYLNFNASDPYNISITGMSDNSVVYTASGTLKGVRKETIPINWIPQDTRQYLVEARSNTTANNMTIVVSDSEVISPIPELSTIALMSAGLLELFGLIRVHRRD